MKTLLFLLLFILTITISNSYAQNDDMKVWMEYMTPSAPHAMLAQYSGEWNVSTTYWMEPGTPPQTMDGTATIEMLIGGRYQQWKVNSSMMGMPFEGIGITGYDNAKKIYTNVWYDNYGTGTMIGTGTYDEITKSLTLTGNVYDPTTNKDEKYKEVVTFTDNNTMKLYMYNYKSGTETKNMEMTFTRK